MTIEKIRHQIYEVNYIEFDKKDFVTTPIPIGMKIAVLSDLHNMILTNSSIVFEVLKDEAPNIIVFAGDMVSRKTRNFSCLKRVCEKCGKIAKVYAVYGNHEQSLPAVKLDEYNKILKENNIKILDNQIHTINHGEYTVNIIGYTPDYGVYRNENNGFSDLKRAEYEDLQQKLGDSPNNFNILITHNPIFYDAYEKWGADLVISGHIHGGIIRLPGVGGILSPERKFFPEFTKDVYKKENARANLYVSAGLGKFRMFNPPEIGVIMM